MSNRPHGAPGRRSLLLVVPLTVVGLVACGGGGGGEAADGPKRAAFVAEADAICAPANATVARSDKPIAEGLLAGAAGEVTSAVDAQVGPLRRLSAPGGDVKGLADATWAALDAVGASSLELQRAAVAHDSEAAGQAMAKMSARYAEATSRAAALGFTACVVGMKPGLDRITASSATFPKATYLSKLESTCNDAILQLARIDVSSGPAAWGGELAQQVSILEKAVAAMKVNPAPPADAAVVAAINSAAEKAVARIRELRDAVLADNPDRARPLAASATALSRQANAKLAAYSPKLCGELFPS